MIDLLEVKQRADLLFLSTRDTPLKKVASSGGGEYAGPCPFCGGRDRFHVQPHQQRWLCRGCTDGKWKDVIDYVSRRNHLDTHNRLDLVEICRFATGFTPVSICEERFYPVKQPVKVLRPSQTWQKRAFEFINSCEKTIWMPEAQSALDYLHHRGLNDKTISTWHLGYNPNDSFEQLSKWGLDDPKDGNRHSVWLPAGIVIPCIVKNEIWYVKVRRFEKESKYVNIKGGHPALFGGDQLVNNDVAVLTEGEFDAMLLWQEVGDIVGIGTLGSSTNIPDMGIWGQALSSPDLLLAAYDSDEAGEKGQNALMTILNSVIPLQVPVLQAGDKDINDFFRSGGNLRVWTLNQVEEILET